MRTMILASVAALAAVPALAACTENATDDPGKGGDSRALTVTSSDDACELSAVEAPSGTLTFNVTNAGSDVTEFYLLGSDGLRIVGEVENIGPNLTKKLTVNVPEGDYFTACKPGMVGEGIRAKFAVAHSDDEQEVSASDQELIDQAQANYRAYVQDQSAQLLEKTKQFVQLYEDGKDDEARALYPQAREHWERIETVAESFGDLDPKTDAREADVDFAAGEKWTGWHRIEKDLWPQDAEAGYRALTAKERATYGDDLLANTTELDGRIRATGTDALTYPIDAIANGSIGLLEEVANGKITGEEEAWSHTDLWDFQANVDGARVAFEGVQPLLEAKDAVLSEELATKFKALDELLDGYRDGDGFVLYGELTAEDKKKMTDAVNALSEPLSQLTAAVTS
ncbi:PbrT family lead (Pb2+) uptake porter [Nocardioides sp. Root79]|nr:PbrT family lead (Pb2+) uptake porter [Nocardioides sp. Root79]KRC73746.1 PbrT family lead (Pb2+) uptake porter [Nocardioides sp. Root240]